MKDCYICGFGGTKICDVCKQVHSASSSSLSPQTKQAVLDLSGRLKHVQQKLIDPAIADKKLEEERQKISTHMASGGVVYRSAPNLLLLDLDSDASFQKFTSTLPFVHNKFGVESALWWYSKSGEPHRHFIVELKIELPVMMRVALELTLGSDHKRGILNCWKHGIGVDEPSLLFVPKDAKVYKIDPSFWMSKTDEDGGYIT